MLKFLGFMWNPLPWPFGFPTGKILLLWLFLLLIRTTEGWVNWQLVYFISWMRVLEKRRFIYYFYFYFLFIELKFKPFRAIDLFTFFALVHSCAANDNVSYQNYGFCHQHVAVIDASAPLPIIKRFGFNLLGSIGLSPSFLDLRRGTRSNHRRTLTKLPPNYD